MNSWTLLATLALACLAMPASGAARKIPVILDTDIGDDIDDTWALAMLLKSPELDVRLVVGDNGNALYRAKLLAKFLTAAGRTDIPVGVGLGLEEKRGPQSGWLEGYRLASYPGRVHRDGVQAIIDTVMASREPVTLLCIGPVQNIAAALDREPRIARRARFVGMHGSVRRGYGGSETVSAEYNVVADPGAFRRALKADWDVVITPLDTCGLIQLRGEHYARIRDSHDPMARALIENYRAWSGATGRRGTAESASSVLFDTVAVYLAYSEALLKMEKIPLRVTDDGRTVIDPEGRTVRVATEWKDLDAFAEHLVTRLVSPRAQID